MRHATHSSRKREKTGKGRRGGTVCTLMPSIRNPSSNVELSFSLNSMYRSLVIPLAALSSCAQAYRKDGTVRDAQPLVHHSMCVGPPGTVRDLNGYNSWRNCVPGLGAKTDTGTYGPACTKRADKVIHAEQSTQEKRANLISEKKSA